VLFEPGDTVRYVYFPTGGMLSLLALTESRDTIEVGMVGSEGVMGLPAILRISQMFYRVTAQLTTNALRLSTPALSAAMTRVGRLQDLLLRYAQTVLTQVTQSAVCNRFHTRLPL
jgi:CRP-like cAMP-binding protein